jgi:hypothetical protein
MATFHPFPRLPAELRLQIWESTVEPRSVDVQVCPKWTVGDKTYSTYLASSTPVPGPLHTCREARNQGLYQQAFSELAASDGSGRPYVWANLDIDVISIGCSETKFYEAVGPMIQRLKLERWSPLFGSHWYSLNLHCFANVKEIYVVCADGMWMWHDAMEDQYWPCGEENVFMVDPDDGRMIKAVEMDKIFDRERAEAERWGDFEVRDSKELVPCGDSCMGELSRSLSEIQFAPDVRFI